SALGEVVVWDHESGREWTRLSAGLSVGAMGFLPDGRLATIVNEGREAKLRLWSQHNPPGMRASAACPRRSMALAVSPGGKLIAVTQYNVEKPDSLLPGSPD